MNNNFGILKNITKNALRSESTKTKFSYFKGALFSIIIGILISSLLILVIGKNPIEFFHYCIKFSFGLFLNETLQWIAIFLIAAIAVSIGFKSGVFNIGVPGQMFGAFFVALYVYKTWFNIGDDQSPTTGQNLVAFIAAVSFATALGAIAGVLKAKFNIHEVVTTIMLNWIVWYLFKNHFVDTMLSTGETQSIPSGILNIGNNEYIFPLIIGFIILAVVVIIFSKTTFGVKIKAVGLSKDAAKNAGINVNSKIIQSISLSAGISGIAGFVWGCTTNNAINIGSDSMPTIGFDAIAISLVAFNNPFGIFAISILWAILEIGDTASAPWLQMPSQTGSLIFGLTVCFSAMSVIFYKVSINKEWFDKLRFIRTEEYKSLKHDYRSQIKEELFDKKELKNKYKLEVSKLFKTFEEENKNLSRLEKQKLLDKFIEEWENAKTELTARKYDASLLWINKKDKFKIMKRKLHNKFINSKEQLKETYIADVKFQKGYFEKVDSLIKIKDDKYENLNKLNEQKMVLKSNYKIQISQNNNSGLSKNDYINSIKKINDKIKEVKMNYRNKKHEILLNYRNKKQQFKNNQSNVNQLKENYKLNIASLIENYKSDCENIKQEKEKYYNSLIDGSADVAELKKYSQEVNSKKFMDIVNFVKNYNNEKKAKLLVNENENLNTTKEKLKIYTYLNKVIKKKRINEAYENYLKNLSKIKGGF
ncbi:ABC transporter permease [Spiroplasma endosymbiont of Crioceris asparagi]|uniref:ABC transporter permease n=1 Tax=Spiroplasma endosymbiont of Crioceris asparagi TaxID=3066286 RepID=UPI0030CC0BFA